MRTLLTRPWRGVLIVVLLLIFWEICLIVAYLQSVFFHSGFFSLIKFSQPYGELIFLMPCACLSIFLVFSPMQFKEPLISTQTGIIILGFFIFGLILIGLLGTLGGSIFGWVIILSGIYFFNKSRTSKQNPIPYSPPSVAQKIIIPPPRLEPRQTPIPKIKPIQQKPVEIVDYEKIGKIRNRTLKDLGWSNFFNYNYDDSVLGKMTINEFHEIEMRLQYRKDQKEKEERERQQNKPQPSPTKIISPPNPQINNISIQSKNLPNITIADIDKMEGTDFEKFLKKLFENMGYSVELTQHSIDMGSDLILSKDGERISIQAKRWVANVGNDAIQAVVGSLKVYKTQRGMVVTNSDFTNPAIYQAHHNHVELWNRDKLIEMVNKYPVSK